MDQIAASCQLLAALSGGLASQPPSVLAGLFPLVPAPIL